MNSNTGQSLPFGAGGLDRRHILELVSGINSRSQGSDESLLLLMRAYLTVDLPEELKQTIRRAILRFRFNFYAQGKDQLSTWTENRQITFRVAQYLAAQTFKEDEFIGSRTGAQIQLDAATQIQVWLSDRFRFGFSEWLSPAPMARCVAALTMLIEHAENRSLQVRATMILDLLLLDAALFSFEGNLASACARASTEDIFKPQGSPIADVLASAFGGDVAVDPNKLSSIFLTRSRYQVPEVIKYLGSRDEQRRGKISQGLDIREVPKELEKHPDYPREGALDFARFWWGMQAIASSHSIKDSMLLARGVNARGNRILRPLKAFTWLPRFAVASVQKLINPFVAGRAIQRSNVNMFATDDYQLSSIQRYHPGEFGGEQHLWLARLRGGINVFGNHPAARVNGRKNVNPWVDNGINPDIVQHGNVLLALQDLRCRHGFLEGKRKEYTHFHFPFVEFDQAKIGQHWVAGRKGNAFVGIIGSHNFEQISDEEFIQRGLLTGYAVVLADEEEFGSIGAFISHLRSCRLTLNDRSMHLVTPFSSYTLKWRGKFTFDGHEIGSDYDRYIFDAVATERKPRRIEVAAGGHKLVLDWPRCVRKNT